MFGMDRTKDQEDTVRAPEGLPGDVIVSPDAKRGQRIPPGQSRTKKWPVLDASGPPRLDLEQWRFSISGLVGKNFQWTWQEFLALVGKCHHSQAVPAKRLLLSITLSLPGV